MRASPRIWIALAGILASSLAAAEILEVKVEGIKSEKGKVLIRVFQSEDAWLKNDQAVETQALEPAAAGVKASFTLKPGPYAVHVFQDENANGKLDMKWLPPGPAEPWVVSNNAQGTMGPPSYKDAKIDMKADQTLSLTLQ